MTSLCLKNDGLKPADLEITKIKAGAKQASIFSRNENFPDCNVNIVNRKISGIINSQPLLSFVITELRQVLTPQVFEIRYTKCV